MVYDVTGPLLLLVISSRPVESNNKKKEVRTRELFRSLSHLFLSLRDKAGRQAGRQAGKQSVSRKAVFSVFN